MRVDEQCGTRNRSSHSAQSGCASHSATQPLSHSTFERVDEWLSGWSSHSPRVAKWLSGCDENIRQRALNPKQNGINTKIKTIPLSVSEILAMAICADTFSPVQRTGSREGTVQSGMLDKETRCFPSPVKARSATKPMK